MELKDYDELLKILMKAVQYYLEMEEAVKDFVGACEGRGNSTSSQENPPQSGGSTRLKHSLILMCRYHGQDL